MKNEELVMRLEKLRACSSATDNIADMGYTLRQALAASWPEDVDWLCDEIGVKLPEEAMLKEAIAFSENMLKKRLTSKHRAGIEKNLRTMKSDGQYCLNLYDESALEGGFSCGDPLWNCPKSVMRFEAKLFRREVMKLYPEIKRKLKEATE